MLPYATESRTGRQLFGLPTTITGRLPEVAISEHFCRYYYYYYYQYYYTVLYIFVHQKLVALLGLSCIAGPKHCVHSRCTTVYAIVPCVCMCHTPCPEKTNQ